MQSEGSCSGCLRRTEDGPDEQRSEDSEGLEAQRPSGRQRACLQLSAAALVALALCAGAKAGVGDPAAGLVAERRLSETLGQYVEGEEIEQVWRMEIVAWSYTISSIGAYVALTTTMFLKQVRNSCWYWLLLAQAGLALGVCSVWSMHFVGMHALVLMSSGKPEVKIMYEPSFTMVSAAAAWLISAIALHIILGSQHRGDREVEKTLAQLTFVQKVRWHAKRLPGRRLAVASGLVAVGVVIMHYMGMLSQTGDFTMEFNPWPILASAFVAILAASVALPIFVTSFDNLKFRLASSLGVGLFVNSMHYTGMTSATYFAAPYGGVWGKTTESWELPFEDVVMFSLILDLVLMGLTGYYVELARDFVKQEEEHVEKRLNFEMHKRNLKKLIQRSRTMRYPMSLLRHDTFVRLGKLVCHEDLRDSHKLFYFNTVKDINRLKRKKHRVIFFSHQWLSNAVPDPSNRQYKDMVHALQGLSQVFRVKPESMYIFVDYSSVPQEGRDLQQLAIDSLPTYVSLSSAFVIVAPQTVHANTGMLCNFDTYSKRFWCRLEVFCTVVSSLRAKAELKRGVEVVEEEEQLEGGSDVKVDGNVLHEAQVAHAHKAERQMTPGSNSSPSGPIVVPELSGAGQQRLFVMVEDTLHPLNFLNKDGSLQSHYRDLLNMYDGRGGDVVDRGEERADAADGEEQFNDSDRMRVVDVLTGAYGAMLQDVRGLRKRRGNVAQDGRLKLAEEIIKARDEIFPEKYFGSRLEAVHEKVNDLANRSEKDIVEEESDYVSEGQESSGSEHPSTTSELTPLQPEAVGKPLI